MKITSLLLSFIFSNFSIAQPITGFIYSGGNCKKEVMGAKVTLVGTNAQAISGDDGSFILNVPDHIEKGKEVVLFVSKNGYGTVNKNTSVSSVPVKVCLAKLTSKEVHVEDSKQHDADLFKKHFKIFDRPLFQVPCYSESFINEFLKGIDDTQTALSVGKLYSRDDKLLESMPSISNYKTPLYISIFKKIRALLIDLRITTVDFEQSFLRNHQEYDHHRNFSSMYDHAVNHFDEIESESLSIKMDRIDSIRNEVLKQLNTLLPQRLRFQLIKKSSLTSKPNLEPRDGFYLTKEKKLAYLVYQGKKLRFYQVNQNCLRSERGMKVYYISDPLTRDFLEAYLSNDTTFNHFRFLPDTSGKENFTTHAGNIFGLAKALNLKIPSSNELENAWACEVIEIKNKVLVIGLDSNFYYLKPTSEKAVNRKLVPEPMSDYTIKPPSEMRLIKL